MIQRVHNAAPRRLVRPVAKPRVPGPGRTVPLVTAEFPRPRFGQRANPNSPVFRATLEGTPGLGLSLKPPKAVRKAVSGLAKNVTGIFKAVSSAPLVKPIAVGAAAVIAAPLIIPAVTAVGHAAIAGGGALVKGAITAGKSVGGAAAGLVRRTPVGKNGPAGSSTFDPGAIVDTAMSLRRNASAARAAVTPTATTTAVAAPDVYTPAFATSGGGGGGGGNTTAPGPTDAPEAAGVGSGSNPNLLPLLIAGGALLFLVPALKRRGR